MRWEEQDVSMGQKRSEAQWPRGQRPAGSLVPCAVVECLAQNTCGEAGSLPFLHGWAAEGDQSRFPKGSFLDKIPSFQ